MPKYYSGMVIAIFVIVLLDLLFDSGLIGRG